MKVTNEGESIYEKCALPELCAYSVINHKKGTKRPYSTAKGPARKRQKKATQVSLADK